MSMVERRVLIRKAEPIVIGKTLKTVSVIIPFSKPGTVDNAIISVLDQDYPEELLEIIVVGKGSEDLLEKWPQIIAIDEGPIRHPGRARNLGAAKATGEILLFLDDDCEAQENWIRENLIELEKDGVGAVSGKVYGKSNAFFARCVDFTNFGICQTSKKREGRLWTATFGMRKDLFEMIGGFKGDIRVQEDIDICFRLNRLGYKTIYQPKVQVCHNHHRTTMKSFFKYQFDGGRTAGLDIEAQYPDLSLRNRFLSRVRNPFLYVFLVIPLAGAGTLLTLKENIKDDPSVVILSPFIFLGKLSCHSGILSNLFKNFFRLSWTTNGVLQVVRKIMQYGMFKSRMKTPRVLTLFVTSTCNSRCQHCFYWQSLNQNDDLTFEEIEKLSQSLGTIDKLLISGGEPFLRRDLAEICQLFFENNRLGMVSIPSNGLNPSLIRQQLKKILEIAGNQPVRINFSIDGTESMHDQLRGVPGNYQKVLESYEVARSLQRSFPNLTIGINSCVMTLNYEDLYQMYDELKDLTPEVDMPGLILLRDSPDENRLRLPEIEELQKLHQHRESRIGSQQASLWKVADKINFEICLETIQKKTQIVSCEAGRILAVVDSNGDVRPCELLPPIGNLREKTFSEIWTSDEALRSRKDIVAKQCHCTHECNIFESLIAHPLVGVKVLSGLMIRDMRS
jgi:MoaA/NifB/PqqE/SkfB family radical SAM enzyme/glycosyltransferase involved in cell wall biosynthesis